MARLIDADKLMLSLSDWELQNAPLKVGNQPKEFTSFDMNRMVWRTIRDCESAVEEQPTVKAIPIDWIERWLDRVTGTKDGDDISKYHDLVKGGILFINMLERDWEKENE